MKTIYLILLTLCTTSIMTTAQDQGMTSSTHEKYVNQIVFSTDKNAIAFKNENPSKFKNSFNASDPLYARLYLDKSIGNTPHNGQKVYAATLMYDLKINGKKIGHKKSFGMFRHIPENERSYFTSEWIDQNQLNVWTTWRPSLLPDESDEELKYGDVNIGARSFALALLEVGPGTHSVELSLYSREVAGDGTTGVLASGSFDIKVTDKDIKALAFKYAPPLPKDEWVGGNKASIIKELESAFISQLNKQPILVGISGRDWNEGTYSLTGQKYRKIAGWAVFEDTNGDGQVPITTFNWISDYSNGGWTKLRFDSHCNGCPNWDVEVAAVKALGGN